MEGLKRGGGGGISDQSQLRVASLVHTPDPRALHCDYVRTLSSSSGRPEKARVVRWNSHPDNQGTTNIEEEDTPEDTTNGLDDIATGAFRFGSGAT